MPDVVADLPPMGAGADLPAAPMPETPSISAPGEGTTTFADSGAGIGQPFEAPPAGTAAKTAAAEEGGGGIFGGYGNFVVPGLLAASALVPGGGDDEEEEEGPGPPEADAAEYAVAFPGADYLPGMDPEFRYFTPAFADGGVINVPFDVNVGEPTVQMGTTGGPSGIGSMIGGAQPSMPMAPSSMPGQQFPQQVFQQGGPVEDPRTTVIMEAADALRGNHPKPKEALNRFVEMFGEVALNELRQNILSEPRMVQGPGGPKDDKVPARINDVQEARLSDGEFVMPADAVMAAGGGDPSMGAQQLQMLSEQLRGQQPTGQLNVERVTS
jgi:hypothetical protein